VQCSFDLCASETLTRGALASQPNGFKGSLAPRVCLHTTGTETCLHQPWCGTATWSSPAHIHKCTHREMFWPHLTLNKQDATDYIAPLPKQLALKTLREVLI